MKFFVTGVGGQLGHDVMNELLKRGHEGIGSDIQENYSGVADGSAVTKAPYVALDITDKDAVEKVITEVKPDAVIHCAAWTAVDMAEDDDKVTKVRAINAGGTQNIADVCKKLDCKMTYISTDYVFDGQGTEPWQPDCKDYKPLNVYGQTKLEGELAVSQTLKKYFIVRIINKSEISVIHMLRNLSKQQVEILESIYPVCFCCFNQAVQDRACLCTVGGFDHEFSKRSSGMDPAACNFEIPAFFCKFMVDLISICDHSPGKRLQEFPGMFRMAGRLPVKKNDGIGTLYQNWREKDTL